MPDLVEVGNRMGRQNGRLLLVSYDLQLPNAKKSPELLGKIRSFLEKRGFNGDCLILEPDAISAFEQHFELPGGVPQTLAIDETGLVVERHEGKGTKSDFEELSKKIGI